MSKNETKTVNIVRKKLEKVGITENNGFLIEKYEQKTANIECDLKYIGSLIAEGFMSGYYPYWKLSLAGAYHYELNDVILKHISKSVADGYVKGEIIKNYQNQSGRGWWILQA